METNLVFYLVYFTTSSVYPPSIEILGVWKSHSTLNHSDFMPSHFVSESYYDSLLMLLTSLRRIQLLNKCL